MVSSSSPDPDLAGPGPTKTTTLPLADDLAADHLTRLLLRCGQGEVDAFATFYRLTRPVLNASVAARRLPPATVDAVLVEVYVTVWRRAHEFPDSGRSVWRWTLAILKDVLARTDNPNTPR